MNALVEPKVHWYEHPTTSTPHAIGSAGSPLCGGVKFTSLMQGTQLDQPPGRICRACHGKLIELREDASGVFWRELQKQIRRLCGDDANVFNSVRRRTGDERLALEIALMCWEVSGGGEDHTTVEDAALRYLGSVQAAVRMVCA